MFTVNAAGISKQTADRHKRILEDLLKLPGNDLCADCGSRNPRWASWNLGIFLCVSCAGVHRNMGVHISKVKSTSLDAWNKEQIASMKEMGNDNSNLIYNPNSSIHPAPTNTDSNERSSELELYIRSKYIHKSFMARQQSSEREPKPKSIAESSNRKREMQLKGEALSKSGPRRPSTAPLPSQAPLPPLPAPSPREIQREMKPAPTLDRGHISRSVSSGPGIMSDSDSQFIYKNFGAGQTAPSDLSLSGLYNDMKPDSRGGFKPGFLKDNPIFSTSPESSRITSSDRKTAHHDNPQHLLQQVSEQSQPPQEQRQMQPYQQPHLQQYQAPQSQISSMNDGSIDQQSAAWNSHQTNGTGVWADLLSLQTSLPQLSNNYAAPQTQFPSQQHSQFHQQPLSQQQSYLLNQPQRSLTGEQIVQVNGGTGTFRTTSFVLPPSSQNSQASIQSSVGNNSPLGSFNSGQISVPSSSVYTQQTASLGSQFSGINNPFLPMSNLNAHIPSPASASSNNYFINGAPSFPISGLHNNNNNSTLMGQQTGHSNSYPAQLPLSAPVYSSQFFPNGSPVDSMPMRTGLPLGMQNSQNSKHNPFLPQSASGMHNPIYSQQPQSALAPGLSPYAQQLKQLYQT